MKNNVIGNALSGVGNGFMYLITLLSTNEVFQWIELGLSILISVVILGYNLWRWWKEASKDGKITKEEIQQGLEIMGEGLEDIKKKEENANVKGNPRNERKSKDNA